MSPVRKMPVIIQHYNCKRCLAAFRLEIDPSWHPISTSQHNEFIVLAGGYGMPAGIDLESKCSEAALAIIMLNDYRHFAHGRHLWLVKRPQTTAVIGIVTRGETEIFTKTSMLVPADI